MRIEKGWRERYADLERRYERECVSPLIGKRVHVYDGQGGYYGGTIVETDLPHWKLRLAVEGTSTWVSIGDVKPWGWGDSQT